MKTKENVFVRIKNAKHAKTVKAILKELNQDIAHNYWYENAVSEQDKLIFRNGYFVVVGGDEPEREKVTLKELIEIIVSEKPKKEDKPKELEVGKWYRYNGWLVNYTGIEVGVFKGYAFNEEGNWYGTGNFGREKGFRIENWTLATEQEVFEALKKEAVKRYIGKTPKCVHGCREIKHTNDFLFDWEGYCFRSTKPGFGVNCLFENGKWAEIIEEVKQPEFITVYPNSQYPVEVYNDKIRIKCNGSANHKENLIILADELEEIYQAYKSLKN